MSGFRRDGRYLREGFVRGGAVTLLDQWGVPLAVLGLLLAMLFMAAVVRQHQIHQERTRALVRRLESGLLAIEDALDSLGSVPLSRELRVTLRSEIFARYRKIRRMYKRYPQIAAKLAAAEAAVNAQGAPAANGVGPIEDQKAFCRITQALDTLIDTVGHSSTIQAIPRDVRAIFCRELGERRAEAMSRFHLVQSKRLEDAGDITRSRAHLTTLMQVLRSRGPSTDFVRELFREAEEALQSLTRRQLDALHEDRDADGREAVS